MEEEMKFYLMTSLQTLDGILGNDSHKNIEAVIYASRDFTMLNNGIKVRLKNNPHRVQIH